MFKESNSKLELTNEEIDLRKFVNLFLRNKKQITFSTLILVLISLLISFNLKKVWEGKFQIVLSDNSAKSRTSEILALTSNLAKVSGLNKISGLNKQSSLETEVGILESSSVLMPIFEYVKNEKSKKNINYQKSFAAWKKNNLNIKLKKDTSILDIKYKDQDKKLIISVLNKMSDTYQIYSGKNKKRNLNLEKEYLKNQVKIYKYESSESLRKLQEYAIDQDLLFFDSINSKSAFNSINSFDDSNPFNVNNNSSNSINNSFNSLMLPNIGIGYSRVKAANKLKKIDFKIKKINEIDDVEELRYIGLTIPNFVDSGVPKKLEELDSRILKARSKYTENDDSLKILIEEKNELVKSLKQTYLGLLNVDKIYTQGILESATRPKEVLLKYKMLLRDAFGDEITLTNLENQLRTVQLLEAKVEDPWELISVPNVKKDPVFPRKSYFGLVGILIGLFIGILYSFFKEYKSGLIFERSDLINITGSKIITNFSSENNSFKLITNQIFNEEILKVDSTDSVQIINKTNINDKTLKEKFNFLFKNKNVSIKEIFDVNTKNEKILLITKIGYVSFDDIYSIMDRLNILNKKIFGVIFID